MSEATITLPPFGASDWTVLWIVFISGCVAIAYGAHLVRRVLAESPGAPSMVKVATAIEAGSMAYLFRQVKTMFPFVIVLALGLFLIYRQIYADAQGALTYIPIGVAFAFLMGVAASYGAGFVGLWLPGQGNVPRPDAER